MCNPFTEKVADLPRDFEYGQYDFNDQVIGRPCASEGFTILTTMQILPVAQFLF